MGLGSSVPTQAPSLAHTGRRKKRMPLQLLHSAADA